MILTEFEADLVLSELYELTQIEYERGLTEEEKFNYVSYYDMLVENGIDIPFAVTI